MALHLIKQYTSDVQLAARQVEREEKHDFGVRTVE
jgi:hypothetical protein